MHRRKFLKSSILLYSNGIFFGTTFLKSSNQTAMTVNGPVDVSSLGLFLPHEHLMSTFGTEEEDLKNYDAEEIYKAVLPYLRKAKELGCNTIADCTAAFFGRDPELLKKLSNETGINILTNTGYYGAANDRYVPKHAFIDSPDEIAKKWIQEFRIGIDGSGIKPGFIKTGVDGAPLSEIDKKLIEAACITHLQTGLTIASHTGGDDGGAASEQLDILKKYGVHPSAWIWVHAQNCKNHHLWIEAAKQGAWIELDSIGDKNVEDYITMIHEIKEAGYMDKLLLSHDGNTFHLGFKNIRLYEAIFTKLIPSLKESGFTNKEINQITQINPQQAFVIRKRRL